jgi:competence protein ComEC
MAREGGKRWLRGLGVALMLVVVLGQALLRPIQPGRHDPVRLLEGHDEPVAVRLRGVLLGDPRLFLSTQKDDGTRFRLRFSPFGPCRVLLQVSGADGGKNCPTDQPTVGRTELAFEACPELRQGWMVEVRGSLRRPRPAPHPLLAGAAERLERQGVWTQLRVKRADRGGPTIRRRSSISAAASPSA